MHLNFDMTYFCNNNNLYVFEVSFYIFVTLSRHYERHFFFVHKYIKYAVISRYIFVSQFHMRYGSLIIVLKYIMYLNKMWTRNYFFFEPTRTAEYKNTYTNYIIWINFVLFTFYSAVCSQFTALYSSHHHHHHLYYYRSHPNKDKTKATFLFTQDSLIYYYYYT